MNISREQYLRFLSNQCSEAERSALIQYLEQHPEQLEDWLQATDWDAYEPEVHLHPAISNQLRERFRRVLRRQRQRRILWLRAGVAAAALALVGSLFWLLNDRPLPPAAIVQSATTDTVTIQWEEVQNDSRVAREVLPGDGSVIKLYAHSLLRYKKGLEPARRAFYLQGVALFKVAKDKKRPFTVYAGGTATTALGTSFQVTARKGDKSVTVKLYEGKVVVQADTTKVYLLPGEELAMNAGGVYHKQVAGDQALKTLKKNTPVTGDNPLAFINRPLPDVLEALKQEFGAQIRYNAKEISTINVTATFTRRDTLSNILTILCTLNDLQLQGTRDDFAISR